MLQNVAANDDVKAIRLEIEILLLDVRDDEAIDLPAILPSTRDGYQLHAYDLSSLAGLLQRDEHRAFGRTYFQNSARWTFGNELK